MITAKDIDLVTATRSALAVRGEALAMRFYGHLFDRDPGLRAMFPKDLRVQSRKLSATLVLAIDSMGDWDRFAPVLDVLARRHLGYGVRREHYDVVGEALIETLREAGIGPVHLAAWTRAYVAMSRRMTESAYVSPADQRGASGLTKLA